MSSFVVRARVACWLRPVTTAWAEAVPSAGCARIDPPSALVVVQLLEDAEVTGTFVPVQGGPTAPALALPLSVKATNPRVLVKEARSAQSSAYCFKSTTRCWALPIRRPPRRLASAVASADFRMPPTWFRQLVLCNRVELCCGWSHGKSVLSGRLAPCDDQLPVFSRCSIPENVAFSK